MPKTTLIDCRIKKYAYTIHTTTYGGLKNPFGS